MTKSQISFFRAAKNISYQSDFPKVHIGCVVVDKHKIISKGCNSYTRTHKLQAELNKKRFTELSTGMLHAEIAALLPLVNRYELTNASLYIYRENMNGNLALCRPCKGCMSFIKTLGIKKIYYTTSEGYAKEYIS